MISIFFISKGIRSLDILSIGYYDRSYFFFVIKSHRLFYMKEQLINNNTYIYMAYITYTVRKIKIIKTMIIKKKNKPQNASKLLQQKRQILLLLTILGTLRKNYSFDLQKLQGLFFFCLFFKKFHNPKSLISHNSFLFFFFLKPLSKIKCFVHDDERG